MKKRLFLLALGVFLLVFSFAVEAQQPGKIPRIGFLVSGFPSGAARRIQAFQQGLQKLGYVEGKTITIEYGYAEGKLEPLPELADELIRLKVDIIVTDTSNAIQAM